jgi:drug/metabolite transporter (DMT)-like permease
VSATVSPSENVRAVGFTPTDALLAVMVLLWGLNYIVLKAVMREITPLAFNALRFSIAALSLGLIAAAFRTARPQRSDLRRIVTLGLLGNTVYQFAFIEGVARTTAGNAALIMAAVPVQTAVLSHLRGLERLRARDAAGLLLSTAGIVTIVLGSGTGVTLGASVVGDLLVFGSTTCWSIYIIGSKPLADRYGSVASTAWTMGCGAVPLVLLSMPAVLAQPWATVSAAAYAGTVGSALGALVIAYLIWFRGVERLGPSRTALYSNFTPVVVALSAWPLLGEVPTLWQAAGAAGIFGGIIVTRT